MNDERPIEKLLRRAAKKRGDEAGPPPELHPANRRALQAEVARQFPKPDAPKQSALAEFWAGLSQRWVYAVGLFVVLGVAAITLLPSLSKSKSMSNLAQSVPSEDRLAMELAKNEPKPATSLAVVTSAVESDRTRTFAPDSRVSSVVAPEVAAAPPVVVPASRFSRELSARRDGQDAPATLAGTAILSDALQPSSLTRATSKAKADALSETAETLDRAAGRTGVAQQVQLSRNDDYKEVRSWSGGGNNDVSAALSYGVKAEEKLVTNSLGVELKTADNYYSRASAGQPVVGSAGAVADGFADKSFVARGGGQERENITRNSQAYSNVGLEQLQTRKKAALAPKDQVPVLAKFKIEQAGRDLRVVDGDGSIYNGVVDEENTLYKQQIARQNMNLSNAYENKFKFQTPKAVDTIANTKQQATEYYLYRVEGTNRSLNQNVVFTWNFIDTNALANGSLNYNSVGQKLDATKMPTQFNELLQNSFINGRAQFGEGREVEVNAVPVQP